MLLWEFQDGWSHSQWDPSSKPTTFWLRDAKLNGGVVDIFDIFIFDIDFWIFLTKLENAENVENVKNFEDVQNGKCRVL